MKSDSNFKKINKNTNSERLFDNSEIEQFPPILSPEQAAQLLQYSIHTIYKWISTGKLKKCSRRRGNHVRINRDALIREFFFGPDWKNKFRKDQE